jgi:hypothetical protein
MIQALKDLHANSYVISLFVNIIAAMCFLFSYYYYNFDIRLLLFICFDVLLIILGLIWYISAVNVCVKISVNTGKI